MQDSILTGLKLGEGMVDEGAIADLSGAIAY
jgi:hypothetical protein